MMLGTTVKAEPKKKEKSLFQNVESGIRQIKSNYELQAVKTQRQKNAEAMFTSPKSSKKILPKINPKVGSQIYNLLIEK